MRVLVLDTGPLIEYFEAMTEYRPGRPLHRSKFFKSKADLDEFRGFLPRFNKILTVPGVSVELSRHFRVGAGLDPRTAAAIWRDHISMMRDLGIEERHVAATALNLDRAALDGPVDVAVCAVALKERGAQQDVTILTGEQKNVTKWMAWSESKVISMHELMWTLRS